MNILASRISRIPVSTIKMDNVKDKLREVERNMIEPDVVLILLFCHSWSFVLIEMPAA